MTALKYQLVLNPVSVCHNPWHPIWMLKVPFGIAPPMPNASQQCLHPMHPVMIHRLYIALVRFGHKTAMTFGYVHAKITPGRSVQPIWQWHRWFYIADTLKSCAFLSVYLIYFLAPSLSCFCRLTVTKFTGKGTLMGPLVKSSVRKTLWATSSAPRLLALMNATISHTFTNTLKVSSNELHKLKC